MDEGDRQAPEGTGHICATKGHAAFVERVDPGENLDQGGLARPVLTEQRQDFAGVQMRADVDQGLGSAELLGYAPHDE